MRAASGPRRPRGHANGARPRRERRPWHVRTAPGPAARSWTIPVARGRNAGASGNCGRRPVRNRAARAAAAACRRRPRREGAGRAAPSGGGRSQPRFRPRRGRGRQSLPVAASSPLVFERLACPLLDCPPLQDPPARLVRSAHQLPCFRRHTTLMAAVGSRLRGMPCLQEIALPFTAPPGETG